MALSLSDSSSLHSVRWRSKRASTKNERNDLAFELYESHAQRNAVAAVVPYLRVVARRAPPSHAEAVTTDRLAIANLAVR
jgi:hypothetical protein